MTVSERQRSPIEVPKPATMWVINSDAQVRRLVDNAVHPLQGRLGVVFSKDLRPAVTTPPPDVVLVNLPAPIECSLSLLPEILRHWPDTHVIFLSQSDDLYFWAKAIQLGAYEFLPRSVETLQLGWVLQNALSTNRRTMAKPAAQSV
jgi:DNA-binding NtrC family response regulator